MLDYALSYLSSAQNIWHSPAADNPPATSAAVSRKPPSQDEHGGLFPILAMDTASKDSERAPIGDRAFRPPPCVAAHESLRASLLPLLAIPTSFLMLKTSALRAMIAVAKSSMLHGCAVERWSTMASSFGAAHEPLILPTEELLIPTSVALSATELITSGSPAWAGPLPGLGDRREAVALVPISSLGGGRSPSRRIEEEDGEEESWTELKATDGPVGVGRRRGGCNSSDPAKWSLRAVVAPPTSFA